MTPNKERAPGDPRGSQQTGANRYAYGSQPRRVLEALQWRWVCGVEFVTGEFDAGRHWEVSSGVPILRYSAVIHRLRRDGWLIARRACESRLHQHPIATMYQWRLEQAPGADGELFGLGLA